MADWMKVGLRELAIIVGVSLLFAWFGVYDSARTPFLPRFGFWFATIGLGFGTGYLATPWAASLRGGTLSFPVQVLIIAALISIPVTMLLLIMSSDPFSLLKLSIQYGYVLVVSLVLTTGNMVFQTLAGAREAAPSERVPDPVEGFLTRLPVKYRGAELYAISAEDHYLRVHTSLGEELILMRLADALRELEGAAGLQTHRSWWVAQGGVADARRTEGKTVLVLKSGGEASVSRRYAGAVKAAGLS